MSNDSSTIDIDSLELERVTGGMFPIPPGQSGLEIPGGGGLSCPAGTSPLHNVTDVGIKGMFRGEGGLFNVTVDGKAHIQQDGCVPVPTNPKK